MGPFVSWYNWIYKELFATADGAHANYRYVENLSDDDAFRPEELGDFVSWQAMAAAQLSDQTAKH